MKWNNKQVLAVAAVAVCLWVSVGMLSSAGTSLFQLQVWASQISEKKKHHRVLCTCMKFGAHVCLLEPCPTPNMKPDPWLGKKREDTWHSLKILCINYILSPSWTTKTRNTEVFPQKKHIFSNKMTQNMVSSTLPFTITLSCVTFFQILPFL